MATLQPGQTLLRTRFGWGFTGTTSTLVDLNSVATNIQTLGICTVTSGTQAPNARTQSGDFFPPLERWIWWENRAPAVKAFSTDGSTIVWEASAPQEQVDTKGMVLANVASGQTLGLWASWAPGGPWDSSGSAFVWAWVSCLISDPTT